MDLSCSPILKTKVPSGPIPVARVITYDNIAKTVDSSGSIGDHVQLVIKRGLATIETTLAVVNIGNNQLPYVSVLINGDTICVQATFNNFLTLNEDCKTIPTPLFGFVPIN